MHKEKLAQHKKDLKLNKTEIDENQGSFLFIEPQKNSV